MIILNKVRNRLIYEIAPILTRISPMLNTQLLFYQKFGRKANLENPQTLNEKILYLKLASYEKNSMIKQCADKYAVREYIKNLGLEKILVPLIAVYQKPEEINWDILPMQFALKWNFGCGFNIICKDKSKLDINETTKQLKRWGKIKYYLSHSEMQYKDVEKRIIVEQYLQSNKGTPLPDDYKFYCFNGNVRYILVCANRRYDGTHAVADYVFFDRDWNIMPYSEYAINNKNEICIEKPQLLDEAIEIAEKLSMPFSFVRTDLYLLDNKIYFGELTFTPAGGMDTDLFSGDEEMGKCLNIEIEK